MYMYVYVYIYIYKSIMLAFRHFHVDLRECVPTGIPVSCGPVCSWPRFDTARPATHCPGQSENSRESWT